MVWEYKVKKIPDTSTLAQIEQGLNNVGSDGWELINIVKVGTDYVAFFKRLIAK